MGEVFQAWSDEKKIHQWWGPHGFTNTVKAFHFKNGGEWTFTMNGPDGKQYDNHIVFHEIIKNKMVIFDHVSNPKFFVRVTFDDFGASSTKVTFRALFEDVKIFTAINQFASIGNEQNFDRLTSLLKKSEIQKLKNIDPELDLMMTRTVDLPPNVLWKGWTDPVLLPQWFCPKPWSVSKCSIDLRPGGLFFNVMKSPEGQEFPNFGCYLEVVENQKLVWTSTLQGGFRPSSRSNSEFNIDITAMVLFEPERNGTQYTAICLHKSIEDRKKHEAMGFEQGWGIALDQLVTLMRSA